MSKRGSGRKRRGNELYETPAWVLLKGLCRHFSVKGLDVLEPACGSGKMVAALRAAGARFVQASDIVAHPKFPRRAPWLSYNVINFGEIAGGGAMAGSVDAIITNPPYGPQGIAAEVFISHALAVLGSRAYTDRGGDRFVAMLLPVDFDSAASRGDLFERNPQYFAKVTLTKRILWFDRPMRKDGKRAGTPSENHAWFIWTALPRGARGRSPDVKLLYAPAKGQP